MGGEEIFLAWAFFWWDVIELIYCYRYSVWSHSGDLTADHDDLRAKLNTIRAKVVYKWNGIGYSSDLVLII